MTWIIDGNNLMGHKGTPRDRPTISQKLQDIQQTDSASRVILVFDGHEDFQETKIDVRGPNNMFECVELAAGMDADAYILQQIRELMQVTTARKCVQVVTADRKLRKQVLETKPIVKGVVNPVVFWKRYRPRLCGFKSDYSNLPPSSSDDDEKGE